uniref:Calmodulin n=1 Tax=Timspurckia oligopyrenoides TaxID=708627 RepID=A0A7S0ZIW8_9RHOD|mmetsp:Transcript_7028/g.12590  ORF Transcript_7028/g.12590 Transcript_7028/m.12590 type:complete len:533 (+) Transcript_7028:137-1735(+)
MGNVLKSCLKDVEEDPRRSNSTEEKKSAIPSVPSAPAATAQVKDTPDNTKKTGNRVTNMVLSKNRVIDYALPDVNSVYSMGKVLGEGAYGTVFLARHQESGVDYACKMLVKSKMSRLDKEMVKKEAMILKMCSSYPNVVSFIEAYEDDYAVYLVMEICTGGELFDRIIAKGHYSEKDAAGLMKIMLETLAYIHSQGIVHRDLKPENYLLDSPAEDARLKLTDFGVSEFCKPGEFLKEKVGSPTYVSPDVMLGKYNFKADIWSLGVICYILLSGRTPFFGRNEREEFERARAGKFSMTKEPWPLVSDEAKDLIRQMLTVDFEKRPSAGELLNHPWIAKEGVAKDIDLAGIVFSGFKQYSEMNKLKKRALQVMATTLKEEDVKHLKQMFSDIDADNSGTVTVEELKAAMVKAGTDVSDEDLQNLVKSYDVDGNGEIDISEFISAMTDMSKLNTVANIRTAFLAFDTDNSGTITADEVLQALRDVANMDIEKAREVVREADKNGDGEIDWDEFYEMMIKHDEEIQRAVNRQISAY